MFYINASGWTVEKPLKVMGGAHKGRFIMRNEYFEYFEYKIKNNRAAYFVLHKCNWVKDESLYVHKPTLV